MSRIKKSIPGQPCQANHVADNKKKENVLGSLLTNILIKDSYSSLHIFPLSQCVRRAGAGLTSGDIVEIPRKLGFGSKAAK